MASEQKRRREGFGGFCALRLLVSACHFASTQVLAFVFTPLIASNVHPYVVRFSMLQELLEQLESKKAVVLSLNVQSHELATRCPETEQLHALAGQLDALNARWDRCCAKAALWQKELQIALLQNSTYHDKLHDLNTQLTDTERTVNSLKQPDYPSQITQRQEKFKVIIFLDLILRVLGLRFKLLLTLSNSKQNVMYGYQ